MVDIPEYKRDDSLDYLRILKALMELPFMVGRNLLVDFLNGNKKNASIVKNNLDELYTYNSLNWNKQKLLDEIERLIKHRMIEQTSADYNDFAKLLRITLKGRNEVAKPILNNKKSILDYEKNEINDLDKQNFEKYRDFLANFNDEQKKAIIAEGKNMLIIAGAGSGKTSVLIKRIEFLIKHKNIEANKILAITFTRKAKEEMQKRLLSLGIENVNVHTFNSFCEQILRKYEDKIYGKKMRVIGFSDKIMALTMALANLNLSMEDAINKYYTAHQKQSKTFIQLQNSFMNDCFAVLDFFKTTNTELYNFSKEAEDKNKSNALMIYNIVKYLKEFMEIQNLRDYTDQLIETINFFKKSPNFIPGFEHILIDEYQDVNASQVLLLKLLSPKNIFAVGDPRQSIYGWRGSDINFILNFNKDFKDMNVFYLTKNYRSCCDIVKLINYSIKEMNLPDLENCNSNNGEIKMLNFDSEIEEYNFITEIIQQTTIPLHEIFVLSRTNKQLNELSTVFKSKNIPHILKTDEINFFVEEKKNHVTLATIHAIKGLEATKVVLMGANSQNFPCKASEHPAIEMIKVQDYDKEGEELRLFYVGISRAKEKLYITYSGAKPTSFINEKMKEILEK